MLEKILLEVVYGVSVTAVSAASQVVANNIFAKSAEKQINAITKENQEQVPVEEVEKIAKSAKTKAIITSSAVTIAIAAIGGVGVGMYLNSTTDTAADNPDTTSELF